MKCTTFQNSLFSDCPDSLSNFSNWSIVRLRVDISCVGKGIKDEYEKQSSRVSAASAVFAFYDSNKQVLQ